MEAVPEVKEEPGNLAEPLPALKLQKSAAIYGANSSGKTNLILAMLEMRKVVLSSSKNSSVDKFPFAPFRPQDSAKEENPSLFELRFVLDGKIYRYGFRINSEKVVSEWLLCARGVRSKESILFTREEGKVEVGERFPDAAGVDFRELLPNVLCLSFLDNRNKPLAKGIVAQFNNIIVISGAHSDAYHRITFRALLKNDPESKNLIVKILKLADENIVDVGVRDVPSYILSAIAPNEQGFGNSAPDVFVRKRVVAENGEAKLVDYSLFAEESEGTQKLFFLSIPWLESLRDARVMFVDELESSLHPMMTKYLVSLFNSEKTNAKNAQLIFVTHDTNLLSHGGLRRDQIWLCEKRKNGETDLYSLSEIAHVQRGGKFERDYLDGRYGAIPFFGVPSFF